MALSFHEGVLVAVVEMSFVVVRFPRIILEVSFIGFNGGLVAVCLPVVPLLASWAAAMN